MPVLFAAVWVAGCDRPSAPATPAVSATPSTPAADVSKAAAGTPVVSASKAPKTVVNSIGMQLVRIPAGTFVMGSSADDLDSRADERPRHRVRISEPFYLGMYEVTQAEYEAVMGVRKSFFRPDGPGRDKVQGMTTDRFPAEQVTWFDAVRFCERLSALPDERAAGRRYRLPTEAEWEYACRAGTTTAFALGDSLAATQANFNGNYPFGGAPPGPFLSRTAEVGSFPANAFGLFDMHGNVWEWCADWYDVDYYKGSPAVDPAGPASGSQRVIRGGDWYSDGRDCRSAFRYSDVPDGTFYALGMRVVMTQGSPSDVAAADRLEPREVAPQLASKEWESSGEEWPRWRGPRGDGTWQGPELRNEWPDEGLRVVWRQPLGGGYGGVSVAQGRVYVMDRQLEPVEQERVLCFDGGTGRKVWQHGDAVAYGDLPYGNGPRATVTLHAGRAYALGATGRLNCLDTATGSVHWTVDLVEKYAAEVPLWGLSASPLVYDDLLIVHAGARPDGCLVALDRLDGAMVWRSLGDAAGYATPIAIRHGDADQLVCWTPSHVRSLDPRTGALLWSVPFEVQYGTSIATPLFAEGVVLVSGYYDGSKAIGLGATPSDARVLWEDRRNMRGLMAQPLYRDGLVFLLDKRHGLTCFELATGKKRWDDDNRMTPKGRNPQATMVWVGDGDRVCVLNSEGVLIWARLDAEGYHELARTRIVGETWAHPAYAGDRVFARSDEELVCVALPTRDVRPDSK